MGPTTDAHFLLLYMSVQGYVAVSTAMDFGYFRVLNTTAEIPTFLEKLRELLSLD